MLVRCTVPIRASSEISFTEWATLNKYIIYYSKVKLCSVMFTGSNAIGQFHDERDKVKINKYVYFHCKLIALTQTVLYVLGKNIFILLANLFS